MKLQFSMFAFVVAAGTLSTSPVYGGPSALPRPVNTPHNVANVSRVLQSLYDRENAAAGKKDDHGMLAFVMTSFHGVDAHGKPMSYSDVRADSRNLINTEASVHAVTIIRECKVDENTAEVRVDTDIRFVNSADAYTVTNSEDVASSIDTWIMTPAGWRLSTRRVISDKRSVIKKDVEARGNEATSDKNNSDKGAEEDTVKFFKSFFDPDNHPTRGEFETQEDYAKRLPKHWDASRICYLSLYAPDFIIGTSEPHTDICFKDGNQCDHVYDADTQKLTLYAGGRPLLWDPSSVGYNFAPSDTVPILIWSTRESGKDYTGENAYGASVQVHVSTTTDYILYFANLGDLPSSVFDTSLSGDNLPTPRIDMNTGADISYDGGGVFTFTIESPPHVAESQVNNLTIVVGIRIASWDDCGQGIEGGATPTVDAPYDTTHMAYGIKCELANLLLIDRSMGKIVSEYDVTPADKAAL